MTGSHTLSAVVHGGVAGLEVKTTCDTCATKWLMPYDQTATEGQHIERQEILQRRHRISMGVGIGDPQKAGVVDAVAQALEHPGVEPCPNCQSTAMEWTTASVWGGQGRMVRTNFVLACMDCSETIKVVDADKVAGWLPVGTTVPWRDGSMLMAIENVQSALASTSDEGLRRAVVSMLATLEEVSRGS